MKYTITKSIKEVLEEDILRGKELDTFIKITKHLPETDVVSLVFNGSSMIGTTIHLKINITDYGSW